MVSINMPDKNYIYFLKRFEIWLEGQLKFFTKINASSLRHKMQFVFTYFTNAKNSLTKETSEITNEHLVKECTFYFADFFGNR